MRNPRRVLFYVQHLLGIGHVFRASRIAQALRSEGFDVHVIWGGTRIAEVDLSGLHMHWLEPLRTSDASFSSLVTESGEPPSPELLQQRRTTILGLLEVLRPDVLMTEVFPFGRRQMRFELTPLIEQANARPWRPLIVSSIRDILTENRKPERQRESIEAARKWFDLVLVHGDPQLITIDETLPGAGEIADRIVYTGIVAPPAPEREQTPSHSADVVVSAGGGATGHRLIEAALTANLHSAKFPDRWLIILGSERAPDDLPALRRRAAPGVEIARFVPDLTSILARAKISVSRAGYNTVADILRARCRSILVPFTGGRETEQLRRAQIMMERGIARMLPEDELTPQSLGGAVDGMSLLSPPDLNLDLDGDRNSARAIARALKSYSHNRARRPCI